MTAAALSPAMLAVLATIDNGAQPDGRSWRAIDALERRELIASAKMPATGPVYRLTPAGAAALEAAAEQHQDDLAARAD